MSEPDEVLADALHDLYCPDRMAGRGCDDESCLRVAAFDAVVIQRALAARGLAIGPAGEV